MAGETGVKSGEAGPQGQGASGSQSGAATPGQGGQLGEDWVPRSRLNEVIDQRDTYREKANILDRMMEDERFLGFLDNPDSWGKGGTPPPDSRGSQGQPSRLEKLRETNPEVAEYVSGLEEKISKLNETLEKFSPEINKMSGQISQVGSAAALMKMEQLKDDAGEAVFPRMKDQGFRDRMTKVIQDGRAVGYQDAYDLAEVEVLRSENKELQSRPAPVDLVLDSQFGGEPIIDEKTGEPKLYKSPQDAIEDGLKRAGWT